jgi:hypothetical protein
MDKRNAYILKCKEEASIIVLNAKKYLGEQQTM